MPEIEYEWALYEDGEWMGGGTAPTKEEAEREGHHYLEQSSPECGALKLEFFEVQRTSLGGVERVPNVELTGAGAQRREPKSVAFGRPG